MMSSVADFRDPRLNRTSSNNSDADKKQSASPSRGDPRLRAQDHHPQHLQNWAPQQRLTQMAQMPQTHYTIGDGMSTYQHLVPNAAAMYPAAAAVAAPGTYQYPGYAAAATYQSTGYGHPAYAAYYAPAPPPPPPPQHIEPSYQPQQPTVMTAQTQVGVQAQTYAPQGAPQGSWAPARMSEQVSLQMQAPISTYMQQQQQQTVSSGTTMPPSPDITSTSKQEGVEQEMQQTQAEMRRQRDDYERRAAALNRELDQLKKQKRELKEASGGGGAAGDRQTVSILKDNGKLQVEIQSKLKEYVNVVDILTGILGDGKTRAPPQQERHRSRERPHLQRERTRAKSAADVESTSSPSSSGSSSSTSQSSDNNTNTTTPPHAHTNHHHHHQLPDLNATIQYNYVHYDPEVHWCRICDAFPRTAKDLLQHLHDDAHRHLMQAENIEIPWHKLPARDKEFPHREGATKRRIPIKGLQFFVSAPAWYCRLCDVWIGDLHCASQHLKSMGHSQNFANFVDQNPQWETEWLEDRKKAVERVAKSHPKVDLVGIEKKKAATAAEESKKRDKSSSKIAKKKQRRKKSKRKKSKKTAAAKKTPSTNDDDDESSSQSSSSSSDAEDTSTDNEDKSKSIRVTMRNQAAKSSSSALMDEQILILENLVKEKKRLQQQQQLSQVQAAKPPMEEVEAEDEQCRRRRRNNPSEDRQFISQWMNVDNTRDNKSGGGGGMAGEKDKYLLDSLKDRLRQKHEAEQRARLLLQQQQQQQQQVIDDEEKRAQKTRAERERRDKSEEMRLKSQAVHSGNREQVKFRQLGGGGGGNSRRHAKSRSRSSSGGGGGAIERRKYPRGKSRSRSRSTNTSGAQKDKRDGGDDKKVGLQKKPPYIGRMPLFKNRKVGGGDDQAALRAAAKAAAAAADSQLDAGAADGDYEMPRQSRFQPGNLARAFIPQPDVVHYPKLTTVPPPKVPQPPVIAPVAQEHAYKQEYSRGDVYEYTEAEFDYNHQQLPPPPPPPPPPKLCFAVPKEEEEEEEAVMHDHHHHHDDLAMLGISSDDMAAQVF